MSAIKKQTTLRWKHSNELTPKRRIVATTWRANIGKFEMTITNWPGTDVIDWEITVPGKDWKNGGSESRHENTVASLKDKLCRKVEELMRNLL